MYNQLNNELNIELYNQRLGGGRALIGRREEGREGGEGRRGAAAGRGHADEARVPL